MSEYVPDEMPPSVSSLAVEEAEKLTRLLVVPDDMLGFVRMMRDWQGTDFDYVYWLEKPWKWERELAVWLSAGKPDIEELDSGEYDAFVARLEVAS